MLSEVGIELLLEHQHFFNTIVQGDTLRPLTCARAVATAFVARMTLGNCAQALVHIKICLCPRREFDKQLNEVQLMTVRGSALRSISTYPPSEVFNVHKESSKEYTVQPDSAKCLLLCVPSDNSRLRKHRSLYNSATGWVQLALGEKPTSGHRPIGRAVFYVSTSGFELRISVIVRQLCE
eukprot:4481665-Pleurochrysis_carterae.AAC.3